MDYQWHVQMKLYVSVTCSKGLSPVQWMFTGIVQWISSGISEWIISGIFKWNYICQWHVPKGCHLPSGLLLELSNGFSVASSDP